MVVPFTDAKICVASEPAFDECRTGTGDDYGVAETVPVSSFVAKNDVKRRLAQVGE
jgi:hypothetical protein